MAKPGQDPATLRAIAKQMLAQARRSARFADALGKVAMGPDARLDGASRLSARLDAARYEGESRLAFSLARRLSHRAVCSERSR